MSRSLIEIIKEIDDPRRGNAIRYNLAEVLAIALLAALCDCTRFTEMELFGIEREEWLRSFLVLENGIPSHDTFGDIFAAIDPEQMRACLMEWTESIREKFHGEIVAVDGKTIRGSKSLTEGKRAMSLSERLRSALPRRYYPQCCIVIEPKARSSRAGTC